MKTFTHKEDLLMVSPVNYINYLRNIFYFTQIIFKLENRKKFFIFQGRIGETGKTTNNSIK